MGRYENKVAVVTGGSTGIGLATARALIAEGARVVITGRSKGALDAAALELGPRALVLASDTSDLDDLDALREKIRKVHPRIDVLFVNAGIAQFAPFEETSAALFDETFGINVRGAFFAIQKLLPLMDAGGSIVLNTSVVDEKGFASTSAYSASKAALRSLARTLSAELVGKGIRVNAVSPGPITTPIYGKLGLDAETLAGFQGQMQAMIPMKRFGQAEEVARAVLFLASSDASFTTGAELAVDGGLSNL